MKSEIFSDQLLPTLAEKRISYQSFIMHCKRKISLEVEIFSRVLNSRVHQDLNLIKPEIYKQPNDFSNIKKKFENFNISRGIV